MNLTLRINNHMLIGWNDLELLRNELNLLWHHDTLIRWRIAVWRAENIIQSIVRNFRCVETNDGPKILIFSKSHLPLLLFGSTVWTIVNCGCWGGCVITRINYVMALVLRNNYRLPVWIAPVVGSCICITCCITKGWTPPLAIVPFTIIWVPPDVGMSICCGWAKNKILALRYDYVTQ